MTGAAPAARMTWAGEFTDPALERRFVESASRRARDGALLCVVSTTLTCLGFIPADLAFLSERQLPFFLGDRLVIALIGLAASMTLVRGIGLGRLLAVTYGHQVVFFTLNALIFNHPALLRHGGVLLPLMPIALMICLPGSFRAAAALCLYAPTVSLLFWGVFRPDPEAPLDLAIVALMTLVAFVVGAVARIQLSAMRREEYLHRQILSAAKEAAEAGDRAKAEFLAVMSHEIRTPVNGVLGMLHLVLDSTLPPEERRRLEVARHSAEHLLRVLDDILDITKLESGRVEFENEPFNLRRVIGEVAALTEARAREKGLDFALELASGLPEWARGDAARLRQILFNLTGNAVKFTETGAITLRAAARDDGNGAMVLRLEVEDTGIGIDQWQRRRLFQAFAQADASINRRFGGTGLGLAICRRLAEGMGGTIELDSAPGLGSSFRVTLRLAPSAPVAETAAPAPIHVRSLRVLLAEDNPVNSEVARTFLTRAGHTVTLAADGAEAVDKAKDGGFDLILMDMRMPKVDGLEATRRIRALPPPLGNVPIVALTANALRADVDRCLDAGMDAHLAKPMTPLALNSVLARVLGPHCAPAPPPSRQCLDVLAAGGCGIVADQLRAQGHRVFAVPPAAALTMLGNRPFELVLAPGGAEQVAALAQAGAVHRPPPLLAAIAQGDDGALLAAGAAHVLAPGASSEEVAALVERAAAPVDLGDLLGSAKVDELRSLLLEGLRVHAPALARPGMAADTLAQVAHRLKGSALALGLEALATAAEQALHAAENAGPNPESLDAARQELYTTIDGLLTAAARPTASQG